MLKASLVLRVITPTKDENYLSSCVVRFTNKNHRIGLNSYQKKKRGNSVMNVSTVLPMNDASRSSVERVYQVVLKQAALVGEQQQQKKRCVDLGKDDAITNPSLLNEAYDRCGEVCAEYAKTFYLGTLLMTPERQRAVWAIYVWCRRTDELVDGPNASHITWDLLMLGWTDPFLAVHIAGTKGKGSTAAFLSNILREEGYSVGCYTSPHLWSIRERISFGTTGDPVSPEAIICLFHRVKSILDHSIELENDSISHFEVLTALAFTLFAQENVDFGIIEAGLGGARDATNIISSSGLATSIITTIGEEHMAALGGSLESITMAKAGIIKHGCPVVLGGPFLPHIECILREKASLMNSPVVLASDSGNNSTIRGFFSNNGKTCQSCDILIQLNKDLKLFIDLPDVKLRMMGNHQLQNDVTAACASLCLRHQGRRVSDESIRSGLENTYLLGRNQFLTLEESKAIGLTGVQILVDGAHTKDSAKSLADTIEMTHPHSSFALVVAMANDKDHKAFAKQLLSGRQKPKAVILTEVGIAGDRARMTPSPLLKNVWIQVAIELGIDFTDMDKEIVDRVDNTTVIAIGSSVEESMKLADQFLKGDKVGQSRLIAVTGSLHIVSHVLGSRDTV